MSSLPLHPNWEQLALRLVNPENLITTDLDVVSRKSCRFWIQWVFSCGKLPDCQVDKAAQILLQHCQQNRPTPIQCRLIDKKIIQVLNQRTHHRYKEQFHDISKELLKLVPHPPSFPSLSWPTPSFISLTKRNEIEGVYQKLTRQVKKDPFRYRLSYNKVGEERTLSVTDHENWKEEGKSTSAQYLVPLSLRVHQSANGELRRFIVCTPEIVGRGGQTPVGACLDLLSGKILVRKNCPHPFPQKIANYLASHPKIPGIVPVVWLDIAHQPPQVYEQFYPDNLANWNARNRYAPFEKRLSLACQILAGLHHLHQIEIDHNPLFHGDIKSSNFLVNAKGEEIVFTDFGLANPEEMGGTLGCLSPEFSDFLWDHSSVNPGSQKPTKKECLAFRRKYGQSNDIWGLGLVLVLMLTGKESLYFDGPAIRCIEQELFKQKRWRTPGSSAPLIASKWDQEKLDLELAALQEKSLTFCPPLYHPWLHQIWDCIFRMLRIDPKERISAKELAFYSSPVAPRPLNCWQKICQLWRTFFPKGAF